VTVQQRLNPTIQRHEGAVRSHQSSRGVVAVAFHPDAGGNLLGPAIESAPFAVLHSDAATPPPPPKCPSQNYISAAAVKPRYRLALRRHNNTRSRGVAATNNPSVGIFEALGVALFPRTILLLPPRTFPDIVVRLLWRKAVMRACYTSAQKRRDYLTCLR
jgi:hypothetical protein